MANLKNIDIFLKGRKFSLKVNKVSYFGRIRGLMFKKKDSDVLLFDFLKECRESIHSLFVFFPFLALWLNRKNEILEYKIVRPFSLSARPKKSFFKLVEIPLKTGQIGKNELIDFLVGKGKI